MAADGLMCEALSRADLLIGFGLDPVEIDKTWHAELPIHWVLEAPNAAASARRASMLVDHAALLDALLDEPAAGGVGRAIRRVPASASRDARRSLGDNGHDVAGRHRPGARRRRCPPDTIVTTDVGSHKYLFGQFWPSREPETFWMSNGLSGMAYGLSAAIGAKLARPDAPVLAAVGDGGFSMNSQELETAERVGAPFVTVVLEDGSYSLIKLAQENRKLAAVPDGLRPDRHREDRRGVRRRALRTTRPDELAGGRERAVAAEPQRGDRGAGELPRLPPAVLTEEEREDADANDGSGEVEESDGERAKQQMADAEERRVDDHDAGDPVDEAAGTMAQGGCPPARAAMRVQPGPSGRVRR